MTGKLDDETWAKRLQDATRDGKLNVSYMDLPTFDAARVLEIKEKIPNLVELDLRSNDLAELPDELAELKNLRNVKLSYNQFETIPPVLTKLKRLTSLNMGGCLLRDVDDVVGDLSSRFLRDLDLSGNRVQTVSPAIARHDKLSYLNLENNSIVTLPEEMGEMENLSVLDLSNNRLAALPETFGGLKGLTRIEVNNNKIEELPPSMGHLTNLKDFDVRYNELREPGRTKALGPLSGLLKFLRDEEQRLIQEEIERLKPVAARVGKYLEYRTKIEAKGNNEGNGGPGDPQDDRPYLRTGHTLTYGANHLFIFGGALAYHDKRKGNDLFVTNLDRVVWRKTSAYGAGAPRERDGHAAVFDAARRRLLIFGGKSKEKKRLDDLYAYDLDEDRWMPLSPDGRRPDARARGREDGGARREHRGAVRRQGPGRAIQRRVRVGHELEGLRLEHAGVRGRDPHAQAGRRAVRERRRRVPARRPRQLRARRPVRAGPLGPREPRVGGAHGLRPPPHAVLRPRDRVCGREALDVRRIRRARRAVLEGVPAGFRRKRRRRRAG